VSVRGYLSPGGFEGIRTRPRVGTDADNNERHAERPLELPVLALGGESSFGALTVRDMEAVAADVAGDVVEGTATGFPKNAQRTSSNDSVGPSRRRVTKRAVP